MPRRKGQKNKVSFEPKTPIAPGMYLPNNSGDHIHSRKSNEPLNKFDLVNKTYIDEKIIESFPTLFTAGSIPFSDGSNLAENNSKLNWDNINSKFKAQGRVFIGAGTPKFSSELTVSRDGTSYFELTSSQVGGGTFLNHIGGGNFFFGSVSNIFYNVGATQSHIFRINNVEKMRLNNLGDLIFKSDGSGLPYGACYQTAAATFATTLTTQNVFAELDAATTNINAGELNAVTFPDDHYLLVLNAGRYLVNYSFSAMINSVAGGGQHVESGIMINGSIQLPGKSHWSFAATSIENMFTGTAILDLAANDQISLAAANFTSAGKILTIDHLNINLTHIGGT